MLVQTRNAAEERDEFFRAIESVPDKDERTHVHVLAKGTVPNFFA